MEHKKQTTSATATLFAWSASSQTHHGTRSVWWYVCAGLLIAGCVAYGIITQAWSFVLVIALSSLLYGYAHHQEPRRHSIEIHKDGFVLNGLFTPWSNCEGFWILLGPDYSELHIERLHGLHRHVTIQTGNVDPYELRHALLELLPEHVHKNERLVDKIIRICKI